jgi:hypothetical protein
MQPSFKKSKCLYAAPPAIAKGENSPTVHQLVNGKTMWSSSSGIFLSHIKKGGSTDTHHHMDKP